ncbi:hypothetical protein Z947_1760 [Sulfitobacter geojensis]|nr:hypothetical protein Z947_1760 [Sulfitobacter geojensis]
MVNQASAAQVEHAKFDHCCIAAQLSLNYSEKNGPLRATL